MAEEAQAYHNNLLLGRSGESANISPSFHEPSQKNICKKFKDNVNKVEKSRVLILK